MAIKDALEALEGRWKLLILFALSSGPKRFKQISKEVSGITDKTLSKELKSLEANKLVNRAVYDTFPPTVEYTITAHGKSLEKVMEELHGGCCIGRRLLGGEGRQIWANRYYDGGLTPQLYGVCDQNRNERFLLSVSDIFLSFFGCLYAPPLSC